MKACRAFFVFIPFSKRHLIRQLYHKPVAKNRYPTMICNKCIKPFGYVNNIKDLEDIGRY